MKDRVPVRGCVTHLYLPLAVAQIALLQNLLNC